MPESINLLEIVICGPLSVTQQTLSVFSTTVKKRIARRIRDLPVIYFLVDNGQAIAVRLGMTHTQAITESYRLYEKWVSFDKRVDLDRVHASMLQEHRFNLKNPARVSPANASETRADLIRLGKVRAALARKD
jgi:hypothetical protein